MSGDKGISAFPESDNLFKWIGTIDGAQGTVSRVYFLLRYEKYSLSSCSDFKNSNPIPYEHGQQGLRYNSFETLAVWCFCTQTV